MRISDWSSDVCSSYLDAPVHRRTDREAVRGGRERGVADHQRGVDGRGGDHPVAVHARRHEAPARPRPLADGGRRLHRLRVVDDGDEHRAGRTQVHALRRSEEHTSELQSLMRISYAVFCLKKNTTDNTLLEHDISYEEQDV